MQRFLEAIRRPSLNWLLVLFPLAVVFEIAHRWTHAPWATPTWIFIFSAVAIIPAAGWMGRATEHLATRWGEGTGGLLNATFGNAAELIIACVALIKAARNLAPVESMHGIVKASLTGAIIGNALLVMGAALLAGGLLHRRQVFNAVATRAGATLLILAVVALVVPALVTHADPRAAEAVAELSIELSTLLLLAYAGSLVFSLHTHRHLYVGQPMEAGHEEEIHEAPWPVRVAIAVLTAATVGVALLAEMLVGSVEEAAKVLGLSDLFVGVIVVAIVGNAAEHSTAIVVAVRNRMDLSLGIAIGSSIQIALFVAPLLVLISHALGVPMDFVFTLPEIIAVGLSVAVLSHIAGDGESNWLEGSLLLVVYAMLGLLFFHLPG